MSTKAEDGPPANSGSNTPLLGQGTYRSLTMGAQKIKRENLFFGPEVDITAQSNKSEHEEKKSKFGALSQDQKFGGSIYSAGPKSALSSGTTVVAFSEHNYPVAEGQSQPVTFLKMEGKPGITKTNLIMIPLTVFMTMGTATDVLQSIAYLLKDEDFYNKTNAEAGDILSNASSYASFVSIPMILVAGFIYDMAGRRWTIIGLFFCSGIFTALFPVVSPSVGLFTAVRVGFQVVYVPLLCNPFVNDYVKVQSRGQANGIQNMGMTMGNLTSVAVLFTLTKTMK